MEPQDTHEIPCEDFERENVAGEMIDVPELDNVEAPPEVVFLRCRVKGEDHMCCSVFNIMFCNCLFLGLAALICSLKARKKMNEGDMVGAQKCSRCASRTNTVAVTLTILTLTLFLVFWYHIPYGISSLRSQNSEFSSVGSYNSESSSSFDLETGRDRSKSKNNHRSQYRPSSNWNRPQIPSNSGGSSFRGRSRGKK